MLKLLLAAAVFAEAPSPFDRVQPGVKISGQDLRRAVLEWDGTEIPVLALPKIVSVCTHELSGLTKLDGQAARFLLRRGVARYYLGEVEQAVSDLREAARLLPNSIFAKEWLALVLSGQKDTLAEANRMSLQLIKDCPQRIAGYFVQAYLALRRARYDEARMWFTEVIKRNPDKQSALIGRAVCYLKLGQDDAFLRDIVAARSKPTSLGTVESPLDQIYAFALFQNGYIAKALEVVLAARREGTHDLATLGHAWICAGWLGKPAWSLVLAKEMVQKHPRKAVTYRLYALALGENGCATEGMRWLKRAVALQGPRWYLQTELGALKERSGDARGALQCYEASLEKRPDDAETLLRLACLLATSPTTDVKDTGRAARLAKRACELVKRPRNRRLALMVLATAQAACGEIDKAKSTLEKALQLQSRAIPSIATLNSLRASLASPQKRPQTSRVLSVRVPLTVVLVDTPERGPSRLEPLLYGAMDTSPESGHYLVQSGHNSSAGQAVSRHRLLECITRDGVFSLLVDSDNRQPTDAFDKSNEDDYAFRAPAMTTPPTHEVRTEPDGRALSCGPSVVSAPQSPVRPAVGRWFSLAKVGPGLAVRAPLAR